MDSGFLIFPESFLEDYMFLGIYPFHLRCPVCWQIVVHHIFLHTFVFLWWQLLLLFHFWLYLGPLFSLMSLVKAFSILFIFSKNQLLDSLIFYVVFLKKSISFISALIFIISFLLLTLRFVVLFQVPLSVKLECLFELFLVSLPLPVGL